MTDIILEAPALEAPADAQQALADADAARQEAVAAMAEAQARLNDAAAAQAAAKLALDASNNPRLDAALAALAAFEAGPAGPDAAAAALQTARQRSTQASRDVLTAQQALTAAKQARTALVQTAAAGHSVASADLRKADQLILNADATVRFQNDVAQATQAAVAAAERAYRDGSTRRALLAGAVAGERLLAELRASAPDQPDDATLLSRWLAYGDAFLASVTADARASYDAAYGYRQGLDNDAIGTPRQRVIAEGQMWQARAKAAGADYRQTGDDLEPGLIVGAAERRAVRLARVHLAAKRHFDQYTKLSLADLRARHGQGADHATRGLPVLADGSVNPLAYNAV